MRECKMQIVEKVEWKCTTNAIKEKRDRLIHVAMVGKDSIGREEEKEKSEWGVGADRVRRCC